MNTDPFPMTHYYFLMVAAPDTTLIRHKETVHLVPGIRGNITKSFIINWPTRRTLSDIVPSDIRLPSQTADLPLLNGGHANPGSYFAECNEDFLQELKNNPAAKEPLEAMKDGKFLVTKMLRLGPTGKDILVCAGATNWRGDNLVRAIKESQNWLILPYIPALVFSETRETLWEDCLREMDRRRLRDPRSIPAFNEKAVPAFH